MKAIKIIAIIIVSIFVLLMITPLIFKSKIVETVKTEINKSINAKVEFQDVKLSLIKSFPNFFFGIYDLSVVGKDEFLNDTIFTFSSIQVDINLASVIGGDQIKINSILIDKPVVNAIVLENGLANWDIVQSEVDTTRIDTIIEEDTESAFSLGLKKFLIKNADITYKDLAANMSVEIYDLNFELNGDFTQNFTKILADLSIQALSFKMDGIRYLTKASINYTAGLDADLENNKFTFNENKFKLNEIEFGFDGNVEMKENDDINLDLKFDLKETEFKDLLSLIPLVYKTDFEDVETSGEFSFNGYAMGVYNDSLLPAFNLLFLVNNAMFKYPDLPDAVDHINIDVNINNPGGSYDNTVIDINRFQFRIADNPVNMILHLKTPVSDPQISAALKANLDFASLNAVIPDLNMKLKGLLSVNLSIDGKLSTLEEEKYEDFNAQGNLKIKGFELSSEDLPYTVEISNADISFSPKATKLSVFDMKIGESDFHIKGELSNYIPYIFDKGTLYGNLTYNSNYINVDEFMTSDTSEEVEEKIVEQDTVPATVFEAPDNIDFTLNTGIKKIKYDNIEITGLTGKIKLKDGKVLLDGLKMYMFEGILAMNGEYNTEVLNEPKVDFKMEISGFDIASTYKALNVIQAIAPAAQNMNGNISTSFTFNSLLNKNMEPIYNTILSDGRLISQSIELKGSKTMNKIGEALKSNKFNDLVLKDIDLKYHIENGVIELEPFTVKAGNIVTEISGKQGLDKSLNYNMIFNVPANFLGAETSSLIASLTGSEATSASSIALNVLVTGFFDDPKVSLTRGKQSSIVDNVKDNIKKKTEEVKKKAKDETKAQAQKIIDKADKQAKNIIAEAEKLAGKVRSEAKNTGNKLVAEADKQGKGLISKAGNNPVKKAIAKESAKKLNREAKAKADKLNSEADKKAKDIIKKANVKADNINREAKKKADAL